MSCSICKDLERTLDYKSSKYFEARSVAYYQVSTELVTQKNVDMDAPGATWKSTSWYASPPRKRGSHEQVRNEHNRGKAGYCLPT